MAFTTTKDDPLLRKDFKNRYLIQFRYIYLEFILPEFDSLLTLFGLEPEKVYKKDDYELHTPFLRAFFPNEEVIKKICSRSVLIKAIYELWGFGTNYRETKQVGS